jgi:ubiquinone/menaquinone biosynthesis C-methylase UbiE
MTAQQNKPQASQVTPERLMQFAWGHAPALAIESAMANRVFDLLDSGPKTVEQLVKESGASTRGLRMILNVLVAVQLLARDADGRYSLTPESATFLVSTKPSFHGGIFRHFSTQLVPKWLQLREIVRTGKPGRAVNQEDVGAEFFQQFVEDIFPMSYGAAKALGESLKLSTAAAPVRVLDLAAGSGVWGIALAQQSPGVSVTAVDWPGVLPATRRVVGRFNLTDRFTFVSGDLNSAAFGAGHQIATLGHILHSEGEKRSRALLRKTFDALLPGGTICIAEFLANDDRTGPPNAMIFAVNMLVNTDEGDTFTFPEIRSWLQEAGFKEVRTLDAPGPSPLILGNKPR